MTTGRPDEPRRPLDGVTPPDRWDDVLARADRGEVVELHEERTGRPTRWVVAAAAAAALLLMGAVAVFAVGGRDDDRGVTAVDATSVPEREDPALLFGRRWTATAVTFDGQPMDLHREGGLVMETSERSAGELVLDFPGLWCSSGLDPTAPSTASPLEAIEVTCDDTDDLRAVWIEHAFGTPTDPYVPKPMSVGLAGDRLLVTRGSVEIEFRESRDPKGLTGTTWTVDRAVGDQVERTLLPDAGIDRVSFGVRRVGDGGDAVNYTWFDGGCNGVGGSGGATFEGDRLVAGAVGGRERACTGADGAARMEQDEWFAEFLRAEPLVLLQDDRLVLWTATDRIELSRGSGDAEGTTVETTAPGPSPSTETSMDPGGGNGPVAAPEGPDDFWGTRWSVTEIVEDDALRAPERAVAPSYPSIDASVPGLVQVGNCSLQRYQARIEGEQLLIGDDAGPWQRCAFDARDQDPEVLRLVEADPRLVAFVDDVGPGWRLEGPTSALVLRREGSFTFARWGCGPADGRTLDVRVGADAAVPGRVVVAVQRDGVEVAQRTTSSDEWSEPVIFDEADLPVPGEAGVTVQVSSEDDPSDVLFTRGIEDLVASCG